MKTATIPRPSPIGYRVTRTCLSTAAALALTISSNAFAVVDLSYLQGLLAATPDGGWVKASASTPAGNFSSAWATAAQGAVDPSSTYSYTPGIVRAWSSFAWDSTSGQLLIYGGGHANYSGNEVYSWSGATGEWSRASLPSRLSLTPAYPGDVRSFTVVDNAAPQSSHTYNGNIYLPVNNMMLTLGGGAYNTGDVYQTLAANGDLQRAGPWLFDVTKADGNKVGGTSGSGYGTDSNGAYNSVGGNMWTNRQGQWSGTPEPIRYRNNTTAYRTEGGKDVVYLTADSGGPSLGGFPTLYRYTVGDVRNGGNDTWEIVGESSVGGGQGAAALDSGHNLYVQTTDNAGEIDLGVWDLSHPTGVGVSLQKGVKLFNADGSGFVMTDRFGISFDKASGKLLLWDGTDRGTLYETQAVLNADGSIATAWTVNKLSSSTLAQPGGSFATGVQGKWKYVDALGAFVALNEIDPTSLDAEVWLYKVAGASVVPEPATYALWFLGLGLTLLRLQSRRAPQ